MASTTKTQKAKTEKDKRFNRNEKKWSKALMDSGWTVIPSVILERQHDLGLDATDINIILQLARHWWYSDNPPHPSKRTIAECMRVHESTVRRHIAAMEHAGFIRREGRWDKNQGQLSNEYHFDGLIREATPHAKEITAVRARRQKDDEKRRTRRRLAPAR